MRLVDHVTFGTTEQRMPECIAPQLHAFLTWLHPSGYRNVRAGNGDTWQSWNIMAGNLASVEEFVALNRGSNIYVGVATRGEDKGGGGLTNCQQLHALFADQDFKTSNEAAVRARLAAFPLPPSVVVCTGGGLHIYWLLTEPLDLRNGDAPRARATLKALACALEADPASAEPAHVLRLPGTMNYKYDPPRPVTFESVRDERYLLSQLLAVLPPVEVRDAAPLEPVNHTFTVEERVRRAQLWLARQAPAIQDQKGDNATFHVCAAVTRGFDLPDDAAFHALTQWNARCQPPWSPAELKRKIYNGRTYGDEQQGSRLLERQLILTPASHIMPKRVCWLWKDRLPLGTFALVAGREGIGKSTLAYTLAAQVTKGLLPGELFGKPRGVIVAATEDSWEHTIVPRLIAAGADLTRVFRVDVETHRIGKEELELPKDIPGLVNAINQNEIGLVLLDPLMSRISRKIDTHKDAEVRSALDPIAEASTRTNACVLGVIHVNKNVNGDLLNMIMGSRAFASVPRSILFVAKDDNDDTGELLRLVGQVKNNLGRMDLPTLQFRLIPQLVGKDEHGHSIETGKLEWIGESAKDIREVVGPQTQHARTKVEAATVWLTGVLEGRDGWELSERLKSLARAAHHSERTLQDARRRAAVGFANIGPRKETVWFLRGKEPTSLDVAAREELIGSSDGLAVQ